MHSAALHRSVALEHWGLGRIGVPCLTVESAGFDRCPILNPQKKRLRAGHGAQPALRGGGEGQNDAAQTTGGKEAGDANHAQI